jgi:hypothetical protein
MASPDPAPAEPDTARLAAYAAGALGVALALAAVALFGPRTALSVAIGATIAVANLVTMSAIIRALVRAGDEPDAPTGDDANEPAADADASETPPEPAVDHRAEGRRGGAAWGGFALLKIVVLFGGIWILLTRGWVDPIPLVVGYGVLPLGIAASSVLASLAPRRGSRRSLVTTRKK